MAKLRIATILSLFLLPLVLLACGSTELFTSVPTSSSKLLQNVFSQCGVVTSVRYVDTKTEIYVEPALRGKASALLELLQPYIAALKKNPTATDVGIESYFIPQRIADVETNNYVKKIEQQLKALGGVVTSFCIPQATSRLECQVLSSRSLMQFEIDAEVKKVNNKAWKIVTQVQDVSEMCLMSGLSIDATHVGDSLVILEPFSFQVPKSELWLASVQLITLLGIFLISGVLLGFLVARFVQRGSNDY